MEQKRPIIIKVITSLIYIVVAGFLTNLESIVQSGDICAHRPKASDYGFRNCKPFCVSNGTAMKIRNERVRATL